MTTLTAQQVRALADALIELKAKVRTALAGELAGAVGAVGAAIRDVLAALANRLIAAAPRRPVGRRDNESEDRNRWDDRDPFDTLEWSLRRRARDENGDEPASPAPALAAVAVGLNVGRWWAARTGSVPAALGLGTLIAALGLACGPLARALLAALAAASALLTAEPELARG